MSVLILPLTISWWSVWYPGSEPGGGSYIAQRILAAKSEKDALGGTLFFNVAHYALRPWPWILVALSSMLVYPQLDDIARAFPYVDRALIGHDMAYPAMLVFLPSGMLGLMVAGLLAAYVSTISTHLNWGTSYLVHDLYRRFIRAGRRREALRDDGTHRHGAADAVCRGHDASCSKRRAPASSCCCRSARDRVCSTCCAGTGGASTRGARLPRWRCRSSSRSASSWPGGWAACFRRTRRCW